MAGPDHGSIVWAITTADDGAPEVRVWEPDSGRGATVGRAAQGLWIVADGAGGGWPGGVRDDLAGAADAVLEAVAAWREGGEAAAIDAAASQLLDALG